MIRAILFLFRLGLGLAVIGVSTASVAAFFGFTNPIFDAFNHFQIILFISTLTLLIFSALIFIKSEWRTKILAVGAIGFLLSAITVVPEQLRGILYEPKEANSQPIIRLMSNNMFGLNYDMKRMANIIGEQNPDIIALQEYPIEQQQALHPRIVEKYPYFLRCGGRKRSFIALYSKTEFSVEDGTRCASDPSRFDNPAARIVARLKDENNNEYTMVVTHLNWPIQINPLFNDALDFGEKIDAMSERKQGEWENLTKEINQIEGPVVVAGDFNSTGWSFAMNKFTDDTGLIRHSQGLLTYPKLLYLDGWRETIPFLSIDHILASEEVFMQNIGTGEQTGSDHLPLYAQFSVGPNASE